KSSVGNALDRRERHCPIFQEDMPDMLRSLFTSATGLAAQQFNLDVVANNLANASTTGFKKSRANFEDLVYQTTREPGSQTGTNSTLPTRAQVGLGVTAGTTTSLHTQGTI